jgi:hypothetical protein
MTRLLLLAVACAAASFLAPAAQAQVPPFFNQQAALFDPEISTLTTGVLNDVQATVSADRKYVTMNMRVSNSELVALRQFTFQTGNAGNFPTGFAGLPAPIVVPPRGGNVRGGNAAAADAGGGNAAGGAGMAAAADRRPSILKREGMTLVGRANMARPRAGAP